MDIQTDKRILAARRAIRAIDAETVEEMLAIVSIAAPPFGESARAAYVAHAFEARGYAVALDEVGNVIAIRPSDAEQQPVIASAHLDTVFPAETDLAIRHDGPRICVPGIADNTRGLAAVLTIARVLQEQEIATRRPIVFVATVGEEGTGDLRGVKHLFRAGSRYRDAAAFISIDGTGQRRVVYRAIGSRRLRVTFTGPGGHSWADFGIVNPVHALGLAVGGIGQMEVPRQPRSSLTVGRIAGGTSVNAVPGEAWCEIDVRSEAGHVLNGLETEVRRILDAAAEHANAHRKRASSALKVDVRLIGDRPSGETPLNSELVRAARAATRAMGDTPELVASSTDANFPISLGIPAIAIGAGGESGGTHTTEEWYSNQGGPEGIERALIMLLDVAGLA